MKTKLFDKITMVLIITISMWLSISTIIQMFKCPKMTQTELTLNIPKSFIGNWDDCKE